MRPGRGLSHAPRLGSSPGSPPSRRSTRAPALSHHGGPHARGDRAGRTGGDRLVRPARRRSARCGTGWARAATCRPQASGRSVAASLRAVRRGWLAVAGDCPGLDAELLEAAATHFARGDPVLGPTLDGGYYLIGGMPPLPDLFARCRGAAAASLAETPRATRPRGMPLARAGDASRGGDRRGRECRRPLDLIPGRGHIGRPSGRLHGVSDGVESGGA